jgi:hypothetical protein
MLGGGHTSSKGYSLWRFGLRNAIERFFGYLKQKTRKFHNSINM